MRIRKATFIGEAAWRVLSGISMLPAYAKGMTTTSTKVWNFYPGGGVRGSDTGEINFAVTTVTKGNGAIECVTGSLSGRSNEQGQALGIKMDFTQPYTVTGNSVRWHLRGKVVLQACMFKQSPNFGPSVTVIFDSIVRMRGLQTPATAKSSNPELWPIRTHRDL